MVTKQASLNFRKEEKIMAKNGKNTHSHTANCAPQNKHMQKCFVCALVMRRYSVSSSRRRRLLSLGFVVFSLFQTLEPKRQPCTFIVKVFIHRRKNKTKQNQTNEESIYRFALFVLLSFLFLCFSYTAYACICVCARNGMNP